MASDKSERLLNLLIMLLVQRHYVSKERIRSILYPEPGDDAFEKMFERDKEDLRSIGVPIEVGSIDPYFEDEPGYRIRADEFQLPEISLTGDEAAVVALATKVWEHARLAEATTEAVRKLTAFGLPVDLSALDVVEPRLTADEPSFDVFWEATQDRTPVEFDYLRSGQAAVTHPAPAAVGCRALLRPLVRRRVRHRPRRGADLPPLPHPGQGPPELAGPGPTTSRPASTSARWPAGLAPHSPTESVTVLVRQDAGGGLRRAAATRRDRRTRPRRARPRWDRLVLERGGLALADELLAYGADVYVESPPALRARVVERLSAVVGGGAG